MNKNYILSTAITFFSQYLVKVSRLAINLPLLAFTLFFSFQALAETHQVDKHRVNKLIVNFAKWADMQLDSQHAQNLPTVKYATEPNLIFIELEKNQITVPSWSDSPIQVKKFLKTLSYDQTMQQAQEVFELCFNQFFVVHEAAHWLQNIYGLFDANNFYEVEQVANRITVEYLSSNKEGKEILRSMHKLAGHVLTKLNDPTPEGMQAEEYFTQNYEALGANPRAYGFYQFFFVKKAIEEQQNHELKSILELN